MDTGDAMNTMVPIAFVLGIQEAYDFCAYLCNKLKKRSSKKRAWPTMRSTGK